MNCRCSDPSFETSASTYEVKDEVAAHEGHPSGAYPVTQGMKVYAPSKITPEAKGLRTMPPTFKSLILTIPVAKTTIFGGVAIGNAKAQLHAKTTGIMNVNGFTCIAIAMEAAMGAIIDAVATLDVNSVSQITNVTNMKSKAATGMVSSFAS